jgi:hypothetical protein
MGREKAGRGLECHGFDPPSSRADIPMRRAMEFSNKRKRFGMMKEQ